MEADSDALTYGADNTASFVTNALGELKSVIGALNAAVARRCQRRPGSPPRRRAQDNQTLSL